MVLERNGVTMMHGKPLTLIGPEVKVGDKAPDFRLLTNALKIVSLSDYRDKIKLISVIPSLDTSVCNAQTRRLNEEMNNLSEEVVVLSVSVDLPFAQSRWCGAANVNNIVTLSDHKDTNFGESYGVLIKGDRILTRAVFVVDKKNIVRYVEYVSENVNHPDYEVLLDVVKKYNM
jgi:thiol peroxidase